MEKTNNKKRKIEHISNEEPESQGLTQAKSEKKLKKANDDKLLNHEEEKKTSNNKMHRIILWFRNDLRLHDNAIINFAMKHKAAHKEVVPVYSFDSRFFQKEVPKWGTRKAGLIRTKFILESV